MDEIFDLTFDQIRMYGNAISRKEERVWKSDVLSTLYGAQCNSEEVFKEILKE